MDKSISVFAVLVNVLSLKLFQDPNASLNMSFIERFHCIKDSFQGPNVYFIERSHCIKDSFQGPNVFFIERSQCVFYREVPLYKG